MIQREKVLEAALSVFAEFGFRGATTRRIAEQAGVNEVTLFRLFKSKQALINEAAHMHARLRSETALPLDPRNPERELATWSSAQLAFLRKSRALIRRCMAELEEHPEMAECMRYGPPLSYTQLRQYARSLCELRHSEVSDARVEVACAMLMGALFSDAMGREFMPKMFPQPEREAGARYAAGFLSALGMGAEAARRLNGKLHRVDESEPNTKHHTNGKGKSHSRTRAAHT